VAHDLGLLFQFPRTICEYICCFVTLELLFGYDKTFVLYAILLTALFDVVEREQLSSLLDQVLLLIPLFGEKQDIYNIILYKYII